MNFCDITLIVIVINGAFGCIQEEWYKFKLQNNKLYRNLAEERKRFRIFRKNFAEINQHNRNYKRGLVTYETEINKFGDLTAEEFLNFYKLFLRMPKVYNDTVRPNANTISADEQGDKEYDSLDWREKGAVTPVKDQGGCGACWIFSAVGVLEGYYFKTHRKLLPLSEQNMVDCISNYTCIGGWAPLTFYYVQHHGINSEEDYPYEAKHVKCRYDNSRNVNVTFTNIVHIDPDENKIKSAVSNFGPVIIAICATSKWRFYKSGVWYEKECCENANHAVLVVGYGRENGHDYWLIKNSMGSNWGEDGYIKIARNKHRNYCTLSAFAYYIN